MSEYDRLLLMAEDELTQYSTDARKIEKLRRKIALSVNRLEQQRIKAQLQTEMPTTWWGRLLETQRQTVALPFWGIAGLGLLLGISMVQPLDFIATVAGGFLAIKIQQWGWKLEAKRLLLNTLNELDSST
ncbi:MAG: hypothetical protein NZ772_10235 [Cyanobacteria bacterium]|nr:hypothetical protein [Cyanobacteriota bacterium]MDW8201834.1 hypothetical protein [Cyanobacteriota bacterium SKYGB_h_bin112]